MNTDLIIMACEGMWTATKRAGINKDRREEVEAAFCDLAAELGKIVHVINRPDWEAVHEAVVHLHTAAVTADELRVGSFQHVSIGSVSQKLDVLAMALGFSLSPLDINDDAALAAVEGGEPVREAAE